MQEHLGGDADETRADRMAFSMALDCDIWRDRLRFIPFRTAAGKTRAAIQIFTFVNAIRLHIDRAFLRDADGACLQFQHRTVRLMTLGGEHEIPVAEQQELDAISSLCQSIQSFTVRLLGRFGVTVFSEARSIGCEAGEQLLRDQAPFGGVTI